MEEIKHVDSFSMTDAVNELYCLKACQRIKLLIRSNEVITNDCTSSNYENTPFDKMNYDDCLKKYV